VVHALRRPLDMILRRRTFYLSFAAATTWTETKGETGDTLHLGWWAFISRHLDGGWAGLAGRNMGFLVHASI